MGGDHMRPLEDIEQLPLDTNTENLDEIIDLNVGDKQEADQEEDENEAEEAKQEKSGKRAKPHVLRRNVEDYLEQKALERRLRDVFDYDDYLLD